MEKLSRGDRVLRDREEQGMEQTFIYRKQCPQGQKPGLGLSGSQLRALLSKSMGSSWALCAEPSAKVEV